jgi:hypothetical protein
MNQLEDWEPLSFKEFRMVSRPKVDDSDSSSNADEADEKAGTVADSTENIQEKFRINLKNSGAVCMARFLFEVYRLRQKTLIQLGNKWNQRKVLGEKLKRVCHRDNCEQPRRRRELFHQVGLDHGGYK